jgi:uncharacterized protein (DUF1778 family)
MKKKSAEVTPAEDTEPAKKQMKIYLTTQEHAVVSTAARIMGKNTADYIKEAVIQRAKIDAQAFAKMIDEI